MVTIRPANDTDKFDFSKADALYNFAKESNMLFRGHTLLAQPTAHLVQQQSDQAKCRSGIDPTHHADDGALRR